MDFIEEEKTDYSKLLLCLGEINKMNFLPELPWYKRIVKVVQLLFRGWCHV